MTQPSQVHVPVPAGTYDQRDGLSATEHVAVPAPGHPDLYQCYSAMPPPLSSYPAPRTYLELYEARIATAPTYTCTNDGFYSSGQQGQPPWLTTNQDSYMYVSSGHVPPVVNTKKQSHSNDGPVTHPSEQTSPQRHPIPRQTLEEAAHTHVAEGNSLHSPNNTYDHQRYRTRPPSP
jgi:hypothetical protein